MKASFRSFRLVARVSLLLAFLAATSAAAQAQVLPVALTTSSPAFNRPAGFPNPYPTGLSGVGTRVYYQTISITVVTPGTYSFVSSSISSLDTYGALYGPGGFDPANALANIIVGDDDSGGNGQFALSTPLAAGTYTLVATTFTNGVTGAFNVTASGPAIVNPPVTASGLSVQYQTGDLGQPTDNQLRPFLQLVNSGATCPIQA